jgi:hypothetical protein
MKMEKAKEIQKSEARRGWRSRGGNACVTGLASRA